MYVCNVRFFDCVRNCLIQIVFRLSFALFWPRTMTLFRKEPWLHDRHSTAGTTKRGIALCFDYQDEPGWTGCSQRSTGIRRNCNAGCALSTKLDKRWPRHWRAQDCSSTAVLGCRGVFGSNLCSRGRAVQLEECQDPESSSASAVELMWRRWEPRGKMSLGSQVDSVVAVLFFSPFSPVKQTWTPALC